MEIFGRILSLAVLLSLTLSGRLPLYAEKSESGSESAIRESALRKDLKNANVVLIVLNSLAPAHLHCYGYERATSPNIDSLAAEGIRFTRCYAQAPTDFSSNAAILTGLDPMTTGLFGPFKIGMQLAPNYYTFAEMLTDAGYNTACFISDLEASVSVHLEQGFQYQREFFREATRVSLADADREIKDWLYKSRNNRFFAFIQMHTPDAPYTPPPPFLGTFSSNARAGSNKDLPDRSSPMLTSEIPDRVISATEAAPLRDAYDENVAYADYRIGLYLDRLRETGLLEKTIVILTSNHGEAFGQHGQIRHDTSVYEEMIRVPFIVRLPGANAPRGMVLDPVVELIDLMPSTADAVDYNIRAQKGRKTFGHEAVGEGASWLPRVWGNSTKKDGTAYAMSFTGPRAVIESRWKYIVDPERKHEELYDLNEDPNETINVIKQNPEEVDRLREKWKAVFNRPALPVQPMKGIKVENPEKTLESLGIVKPRNKEGR